MPDSIDPPALDERLVHRGRYVSTAFLLKSGDREFLITIAEGRVRGILQGPHLMPRWTFALKASDADWKKLWSPHPIPGFNDVLALAKARRLSVEGDQLVFMSNLLYFKQLIAILGGVLHAS